MNHRNGFTLVEIMIVVIIIGILASIALPSYYNLVEKSRWTEAREVLLKAQAGYFRLKMDGEEGTLNVINFWTKLGMSDPNTLPCARNKFQYWFDPVRRRVGVLRYLDPCAPTFTGAGWIIELDPASGKTPYVSLSGGAPSF